MNNPYANIDPTTDPEYMFSQYKSTIQVLANQLSMFLEAYPMSFPDPTSKDKAQHAILHTIDEINYFTGLLFHAEQ